jgi:hypothetical protein
VLFSTNNSYFSDNILNLNINNNFTLEDIQNAISDGKKIIISRETALSEDIINYLTSLNNINLFNEQNDDNHLKVYDYFSQNNLMRLS